MTRRRPIPLLVALLMLGMSATPDASAQTATIEGHARAEVGSAPVQFALVRLVRADSSPLPLDSPPEGITNGAGRYRFDGVATRDDETVGRLSARHARSRMRLLPAMMPPPRSGCRRSTATAMTA